MIYEFERCRVDEGRRELWRDGERCYLEPQAFDLLICLLQNHDRVLSKDEILTHIAGGRFVSDAVLSTRLNEVRRAIGDDGNQQRLIRTFRRKGVRFVGEVREEAFKIPYDKPRELPAMPVSAPLAGAPAIAVMPFTIVGDNQDECIADGLSEEIISALSKFGWFSIVSRALSFSYKGRYIGPIEIARQLKAQYIVDGSYRKVANKARITIQLVDCNNGYQIWCDRFEQDLDDVFALQDEIALKVATAAANHLFMIENMQARVRPTVHLTVWQCIIRSLSLINTRNKAQIATAEALLKRVLKLDPESAIAYSLLSFIHTLRVHMGWLSSTKVISLSEHLARRAIALNPDEAWAHLALGYAAMYANPNEVFGHLEAALKLDPSLSMAHYLTALAAVFTGDCEKAFTHADLADRVKQYDLLARGNLAAVDNVRATASFVAARYSEGITYARKAIRQTPLQVPAHRQLVLNSAAAGRLEEARHAFRVVKQLSPRMHEWMEESSKLWTRRNDFKNYLEAFQIAGFK